MKTLLLAALLGWPLIALPQNEPQKKKVERAVDRCKAQRGVDCDTPQGLKEWVQQERSRQEAVRDGSRHKPTPVPR